MPGRLKFAFAIEYLVVQGWDWYVNLNFFGLQTMKGILINNCFQSVFMNTLQTELGLVTQKYPSHQLLIGELYHRDADFKSLCADLFLCTQMIQGYELEIIEKQRALEEYRDIVKELESELLTVIKSVHSDD
jgi:hypothetical protein